MNFFFPFCIVFAMKVGRFLAFKTLVSLVLYNQLVDRSKNRSSAHICFEKLHTCLRSGLVICECVCEVVS
jgi:hypothetical protein